MPRVAGALSSIMSPILMIVSFCNELGRRDYVSECMQKGKGPFRYAPAITVK